MTRLCHILVPTDFSRTSLIAFEYALDMAERQGCAVHLLHVIDDVRNATAYPDALYAELPALRARLTEEADVRLEKMMQRCEAAGVKTTRSVVVGRPSRVIAEVADARSSDVIIMGTHGRSGFSHENLGSITERVLRIAPCAVLAVRDTSRLAQAVLEKATHDIRPESDNGEGHRSVQ